MAKQTRRTYTGPNADALKAMADFRYNDLKAACIMKGMDPTEVVEGDSSSLSIYFTENWLTKKDRTLLEDFDIWMRTKLIAEGKDPDDPLVQFSQFSNSDEDGENIQVKTRKLSRANVPKKVREKKKRSKFGIFEGTKKEYTYTLADDLLKERGDKYTNKELMTKYAKKMVSRVEKKYPDAKPKSVRIWMKRALEAVRPTQ